ncbi:hypothetical protein FC767_10380, partial [Clostridium sporogenes]|nr:hypothetical protein [Clostridium sporogenes]NFE45256.1 hypothetical protein [Clostridium sporogenes]NFF16709.1 hypothetical protein [Clostridium sporogenes]NFF74059.1 hypothetical protein [Clostridium sporogenes]NFF95298.1 hypothetical protein [Clostridium sporogenes]
MEKSGFFNAMKVGDTWDRVYKADNFAGYFATFIGNGVFPNPAKQLQVIETDRMNVIIKPGKAWINGFIYINTDELILPIDVADGVLHRTDKIVLRYDVVEREIRVKIKKGEFASEPKAPQLTRNADMYELALADIKVNAGAIKITQADITDLRLNKELCGIVHGVVDQVDTTAIFNQFQSWYSQTKEAYDKDIVAWTKEKKEAFDKWYAENTKTFLDKFNKWYEDNTKQWEENFTNWFEKTEIWENKFTDWFATIKGQLDGDIAAKLTVKTIELEEKINTLSGASGEKEKLNKEDFNTFKTNEFNNFKKSTETQLADITTYSTYKLNKDENDIYTEIQHKRKDGKLIGKSILSGG